MIRAVCLFAALVLGVQVRPALAQSVQKGDADTQDSPKPGIFKPFDRVRAQAADAGITLAVRYTSELAYNPIGGEADRVTETGQADFDAKLDLGKVIGLKGGTLNTVVTWRRGKLLDDVADLGTLQQTQEVFGRGQTWRLTRFWYGQAFGNVSLKMGRSNVGEDFASFSCDFMNLTFCGAQPGNLVGNYWFNWPVSQWMVHMKFSIGDAYVQAGVFEVNPRNLRKAFTIGYLHAATGVLLPIEAVWNPKLDGLPGSYRIGAWYDTSRADDVGLDRNDGLAAISGLEPPKSDGRSGAWAVARQQVTGTVDEVGTVHGLSLFARFTQADHRTARLSSQIAAGVFYEGLHAISLDDAIGAAVGRTHVNDRIAAVQHMQGHWRAASEYAAEVFYSFHPVAGIVLRPNIQYVVHPGGLDDRRNVVVVGIKTAVNL